MSDFPVGTRVKLSGYSPGYDGATGAVVAIEDGIEALGWIKVALDDPDPEAWLWDGQRYFGWFGARELEIIDE